MGIPVLFSAAPTLWDAYRGPLQGSCHAAGVPIDLYQADPEGHAAIAPDQVAYIVCAPSGPIQDFRPFTAAKAVLNLWAGVEEIAPNPTLTQPLARMVDPTLTQGMVEWVCGHVLRHHLGMDRYLHGQDGVWAPHTPPLASDRAVTILGLGALGSACAQALAQLGFPVTAWSRRAKSLAGIRCLSGSETLAEALASAEILVLLLPLTATTESLLDAQALAQLPKGAVVVNPGRGGLIADQALLAALGAGHVAHATLDVFREEPLPPTHPFWAHPKVTVTPHIAAVTRPATAAPVIAENIRRGEAGLPFLHLVDRANGY